jgi:hypothetical protein
VNYFTYLPPMLLIPIDGSVSLEQPSDFASHSAQREFASPFCHSPIGNKKDVKPALVSGSRSKVARPSSSDGSNSRARSAP